ncbi:purine-nucleoside phosphorylase [Runella slithyformis]|uniref:Purine nucleoside phosphorylase n=1 Tax=Runella slithyformis (strain ATCC 29530 / DSM 19594 / LMG 11500 / NCIMB 11436 / LSU 4) TaxID=761193 RepID=A0A7U3ZPB6_RUNSL|nr:purine-nucleoside phosphorylase [Runella slithyformis]AEI50887.1 purine nucleoside phosphorylase I, inosine and guanosine-specific [Runella slithyformis DSM 19594]
MTLQQIQEAAEFIQQQTNGFVPQAGIILGTGLGALVQDISIEFTIDYAGIPHFPLSTVESHKGRLLFGTLSDKKVVCMQGRFHYYEGYTMQQVTFPVRVMKLLGIEQLIVSNAAGGLNEHYQVSDLMIISDHIGLFLPENALIGTNLSTLGDRFPDMSEPYDASLVSTALDIAKANGIRAHAGVYASVTGPQLETKAEYRMLRLLGADAVGMSTVPEVIVARHMDLPVVGISVITDMCIPEQLEKAEIQKILTAAFKAEPNMTLIIKKLLSNAENRSNK